jgi:beta-lactamase regulating signal transducer with metallopeptidase domain
MKYRDHLIIALHIILRSFLFFHPIMTLLSRHLSLELEYRADAETIGRMRDRARYASFLYDIALRTRFETARALSMKSWLRKRIERIIEPGGNRMKRNINNLFALLATAMLMVAGVWLAAPPLYADGTPRRQNRLDAIRSRRRTNRDFTRESPHVSFISQHQV